MFCCVLWYRATAELASDVCTASFLAINQPLFTTVTGDRGRRRRPYREQYTQLAFAFRPGSIMIYRQRFAAVRVRRTHKVHCALIFTLPMDDKTILRRLLCLVM